MYKNKILALATLTMSSVGTFSKDIPKTNVLFITVDDLRPELNCFGESQIVSPNIDKLAKSGVVFTNAYCNIPVSGASRASLLTGCRPYFDGFSSYLTRADKAKPNAITLPKYFKNNGYKTISNGKIFHNQFDSKDSWDENWRPKIVTSWRDYQLPINKQIETTKKNNGKFKRGYPYEKANVNDTTYFDGKIANKAIKNLRKLKESKEPFFLAVGFRKPHLPFNAPTKYWDLYNRKDIKLPINRSVDIPSKAFHNWSELRQYYNIPAKGKLSDSLARTLIHGYYASVSYVDSQIGRVLEEFQKLGLDKNTVVVLVGDHGWNLREHGLWCKHCNFNTSLRTPLIIKAPNSKHHEINNSIVELVDIYPTICDFVDLKMPKHIEGISLKPIITNTKNKVKDFAISKWHNGITITTKNFSYTEWLNKKHKIIDRMLFNHQTDRDENINIANNAKYKNIIKDLSKKLHNNWGEYFFKH